jgi:hypothetical protein
MILTILFMKVAEVIGDCLMLDERIVLGGWRIPPPSYISTSLVDERPLVVGMERY